MYGLWALNIRRMKIPQRQQVPNIDLYLYFCFPTMPIGAVVYSKLVCPQAKRITMTPCCMHNTYALLVTFCYLTLNNLLYNNIFLKTCLNITNYYFDNTPHPLRPI